MQQGQADILIARFPDPKYGVKMVNLIINSSHLSWASHRFLFASLRGLFLVHACWSNASFYYAKTKEITMDFRNKASDNILSRNPCQNVKGLREFRILEKEHHFEIPITPMQSGFNEGHENNTHFMKR